MNGAPTVKRLLPSNPDNASETCPEVCLLAVHQQHAGAGSRVRCRDFPLRCKDSFQSYSVETLSPHMVVPLSFNSFFGSQFC